MQTLATIAALTTLTGTTDGGPGCGAQDFSNTGSWMPGTAGEAAHALGMSRWTVYLLVANGDVPSVRIGASRRIPAEGLRRYVARLAAGAADQGPRTAGTRRPKQQALWE
jgi:excisionase family DNA binding protein